MFHRFSFNLLIFYFFVFFIFLFFFLQIVFHLTLCPSLRSRYEQEIDEEQEATTAEQQEFNNAHRGNVNTGHLSKNDRELFTSFRANASSDLSSFHRGQWRYAFKPKDTDSRGADRVDYKARKSKGMVMEEPATSNTGVPGTRRDLSSSFSWRIDGGVVSSSFQFFLKKISSSVWSLSLSLSL